MLISAIHSLRSASRSPATGHVLGIDDHLASSHTLLSRLPPCYAMSQVPESHSWRDAMRVSCCIRACIQCPRLCKMYVYTNNKKRGRETNREF